MRASSVLLGFPTSEWRDSNPRPRGPQPRALPTAPHSETVAILPRSRSPDGPKRRMAASHAGRDSNPDQRFWRPPCLPLHHRRKGRRPPRHARRRPALRTEDAIDASREPRAGFEPATCRLRGGCATTGPSGPDGPSHRFFQCMMRVCPHGCLVRRATGGTVWWSRRDSNPRPSRCERDALPLRHGPMPALPYAGRAGWKRSHSGGGITPLVPPAGFEPATPTLGGWRSIP